MIAVSPSSASVASSSANSAQTTRETVVLTIVVLFLVALVVVVAASVRLAAHRASGRRIVNASAREAVELIQTPAEAWRCIGTLESMLPAARRVAECADARDVVVECDVAMSPMNEPVGMHVVVVPEKDQDEAWNEFEEEMDITSMTLAASKPIAAVSLNESKRLSWVEDEATAPLWANLRRDESPNNESDKSQGLLQALAARW